MWLPLFLRVEGRAILVVGAGEIALRKATDFTRAGAHVTIVSPDRAGPLPEGARFIERAFSPSDVNGAWLVVAATNDPAVQASVAAAAERAHTFVLAVDDLTNATAISPAVVRRGPITLAISSNGEAPALTRLIRELIEQILPEDRYIEAARTLRAKWKRENRPMHSRFADLLAHLTPHA